VAGTSRNSTCYVARFWDMFYANATVAASERVGGLRN